MTPMRRYLVGVLALMLAAAAPVRAAEPAAQQSIAAIQRAVEDFLHREIQGLPGTTSFTVGPIEPRLNLAPCPFLETFAAPGTRPLGRSSVGVRCSGPTPWSIYVPVTIRLLSEYVVSARPLPQGATVAATDLTIQRGDLAQLPAGIITSREAAVGRKLTVGVAAGQPIREDILRMPLIVQQGQAVTVISRGRGFQVSADGRAITSAHAGQVVQVRMSSGQVISGIARPGPVVEVSGS